MEKIELLKKRSFGEVVGDAFAFIRLNLAVILKVHFLLSLPIIILTAGLFLVLFRDYFSLLRAVESGPFVDSVAFRDKSTTYFVSMLFSMMAVIPISINTFLIVHCYQRSTTGKVTFEEVFAIAKRKYLHVLAAKLIVAPIIFFTGLILILPGIAFFTLFLSMELLIIQHNFGVFKAISRSSSIMSKYFWAPFLHNLVFLILYLVLMGLMNLPVLLLEQAANLSTGMIDIDSPWTIVAMSVRTFNTIIGYILYTIPTVAMTMNYYSIREQSSQSSIMDRIRKIGMEKQKSTEYRLGDEQY